jgi:hypothetical protein
MTAMVRINIASALLCAAAICSATDLFAQRTLGGRTLQLDDNQGKFVQITPSVPLTNSYTLKLPSPGPPYPKSYMISDEYGQMRWLDESEILPPLAPGNIWVGSPEGKAVPLPPLSPGAFMALGPDNMPYWTTEIPPTMTMSFAQITSGILPPGVNLVVGPGSSLTPDGGEIIANGLSGAGIGKFSGKIAIPTGADFLDVSFPGIQAGSAVNVMVNDPNANVFGYVTTQVEAITPGVGFRVTFAASYPPSGTGQIHWTVVNP